MRRLTHSMRGTKVYRAWRGIKDRCERPANNRYEYYGARGISICKEWHKSFEAFYAYVGDPPSQRHSIDRIDNGRNYEPGNVRWATGEQQNRNTRRNHFLTHNGQTQPISVWAAETGIGRSTIQARIQRGWSAAQALTEPVQAWGR